MHHFHFVNFGCSTQELCMLKTTTEDPTHLAQNSTPWPGNQEQIKRGAEWLTFRLDLMYKGGKTKLL